MMISKIFRSKTMIFNLASLAAGVAAVLVENDLVKQNPELVAILAGTVIPVANMILRAVTKKPLAEKTSLSE